VDQAGRQTVGSLRTGNALCKRDEAVECQGENREPNRGEPPAAGPPGRHSAQFTRFAWHQIHSVLPDPAPVYTKAH